MVNNYFYGVGETKNID